ncbi:hypothetical protein Pyrfu_0741 [Pyrolobus fumarii 1A]|uniref:Uncharacterized protein n=1 Tax=Pyrolobus fumarii (strain DSM 11204 / 1A) TaxID=694429 RepID=G0EDC5_PYRF1|nr:hypothetical protein [Pyrolobus fumarii]AEM38610.1 hypothetical protein Pyrfu_0741 [Pyrolobus fumarii 1A]
MDRVEVLLDEARRGAIEGDARRACEAALRLVDVVLREGPRVAQESGRGIEPGDVLLAEALSLRAEQVKEEPKADECLELAEAAFRLYKRLQGME